MSLKNVNTNNPVERAHNDLDEFTVVESFVDKAEAGLNPYDMEPITSKVQIKSNLSDIAQSLPWA